MLAFRKYFFYSIIFALLDLPVSSGALNLEERPKYNGSEICEQAYLLFPEMLGEISKRESGLFCFDKEFKFVFSKSCQKDCLLAQKAKADKDPLKYRASGNPGSWLCERYGGESKTLYIEYQGKKNKQNFCLYKGEAVSTPYLLMLKNSHK